MLHTAGRVSNGRGSGSSMNKSPRSNAVCAPGTKKTCQSPHRRDSWRGPGSDCSLAAMGELQVRREFAAWLYVPKHRQCRCAVLARPKSACSAPADARARKLCVLDSAKMQRSVRGKGANTRYVCDILPHDDPAAAHLLVCAHASKPLVALANKMARSRNLSAAGSKPFQKRYVSQPHRALTSINVPTGSLSPYDWFVQGCEGSIESVMANRSDRDPPSLDSVGGQQKSNKEMRRGSADSIRASRVSLHNRPDIKLQPILVRQNTAD